MNIKDLKKVQKRLEVDSIVLGEIKINLDVFSSSKDIKDILFRAETHTVIVINNSNKYISIKQQDRVLISHQNSLDRYTTVLDKDSTGLGYQAQANVITNEFKIIFISAY